MMRLSDLKGRDIVNVQNGSRLGAVADADFLLDGRGQIKAMLLPRFNLFKLKRSEEMVVPWDNIKKIGDNILFVDVNLDDKYY
ncbi:MAG TPA: YlmC/YmxH family sporulation protein [Firmicutes bacterium]|nr:YlmC/YmxH family sporulation protein [Bacillota bacterium]